MFYTICLLHSSQVQVFTTAYYNYWMKRVKANVFIQDPFNPMLFTEDAERYVDVSNIVCALTCYNYRKDTLEVEEDFFLLSE